MTTELADRIDIFLDAVPSILEDVEGTVGRAKAYRAALFSAGLAGLDIPRKYGGAGLDESAAVMFTQLARGRVPPEDDIFVLGVRMALHTLLEHAHEALVLRYAEPMLRGDEIWCQMYSEPGAGSDLASLQTRAEPEQDGSWRLNGQKIWTSGAQRSQYATCLARTDPAVPKHKGITMFVLPLEQPGVVIRPIRQITDTSEFNEIFLDDALVPPDHVVGEVNRGWQVAVSLMRRERNSISNGGGRQPVTFDRLREIVIEYGRSTDPIARAALTDCYIGQRIAGLLAQMQAEAADAGQGPGPETSVGKLWRSANGRAAAALVSKIAYGDGVAWARGSDRDDLTFAVLDACALSLGGGTDEIQKNTLAEQALGLPRDPFRDDQVAFNALTIGTQQHKQGRP